MSISEAVVTNLDLIGKTQTVVDQGFTSWRVVVVAAMVGFDASADPDANRQWWIELPAIYFGPLLFSTPKLQSW